MVVTMPLSSLPEKPEVVVSSRSVQKERSPKMVIENLIDLMMCDGFIQNLPQFYEKWTLSRKLGMKLRGCTNLYNYNFMKSEITTWAAWFEHDPKAVEKLCDSVIPRTKR